MIDTGREAALATAEALKAQGLLGQAGQPPGKWRCRFVTDDAGKLSSNVAELFLGRQSVDGPHPSASIIESYPDLNIRREGNGNVKKDDYDINIIGRQDYADFPEGSGEIHSELTTVGSYTRRGGARITLPIKNTTRTTGSRPAVTYCAEGGGARQGHHDAFAALGHPGWCLEQGKRHLCAVRHRGTAP